MIMYPEFVLAFSLTSAVFTLGLLLVCIPRLRKKGFHTEEELALEKREKSKLKSQNRARKKSNAEKKWLAQMKKERLAMQEKKR